MKQLIDIIVQTDEDKRLLEQELVILNATEFICQAMNDKKITKKELASHLNVVEEDITQFLDGEELDIRMLVDLLWVLGYKLNLTIS